MPFNLHPPLSAFPVAFIVIVFVLEIILLVRPNNWCAPIIRFNLWVAVIGVIAAFYSGYYAGENAQATFEVSQETIAFHHNFGRILLFSVFPLLGLRLATDRAKFNKKIWLWSYRIALVLSLVLVLYTGYLGGQLVFEHGAGVRAVK